MTSTPSAARRAAITAAIHFPTAHEHGPFPFPTALSMARLRAVSRAPQVAAPSAGELRLMADTMPGDGPGD